ncbi:MAG: hypothetical protein IKE73_03890 [Bacilli bacterium]|nr:hypothetical protein [Bacilli bacterium]
MIDISANKELQNIGRQMKTKLDTLNDTITRLNKYYADVEMAWTDDLGKEYLAKTKTYINELKKLHAELSIEYNCIYDLFGSFEKVDSDIQSKFNNIYSSNY